MKTVTLSNGVTLPEIGMGTWPLKPEAVLQIVPEAIKAGYRLFDTARYYANEAALGEALQSSGLARKDYFLVTKLWFDTAGESASQRAIDESLARLKTDYVDLILIHQPYGDYYGTYRAMQKAYAAGKARAIGVSNFTPERVLDLAHFSDVAPMVDQLEIHLYHQKESIVQTLQDAGITVMAWAPLGKATNGILTHPTVLEIAKAHGKTPAQIALRHCVERGIIAVPKASSASHLKENIDVFDFALNESEMRRLAALNREEPIKVDPLTMPALKRFLVDFQ